MKYYSLNKISPPATFKEATISGLAPDKGLYFPESIPLLNKSFIRGLKDLPDDEIAFSVMRPYLGDEMPAGELSRIVSETINFPIPLRKINAQISTLELYHGPTLAFKDVGARFMSRCLGYFMKNNSRPVTVLVATSGDTGGAVANGFLNVEGVNVVILYPSGKVSSVQEKQLVTLGNNILALEIDGTFDDCQRMVKQAFADELLSEKLHLTSANSINIARWLPQQIYYLLALKQWPYEAPPVVCVPSGNFGNICAGILAYMSGMPVQHFIAACNANKVVTTYLQTGKLREEKAIPTISNAMDVGNPSNFIRILELFHHEFGGLSKMLSSFSISDEETRNTIKTVFETEKYLLDPHGAVAFAALDKYLQHRGDKGYFLETAHPIKFFDVVEPVINEKIAIPNSLTELLKKQKQSTRMRPEFTDLRSYLLDEKSLQ